MKYSKTLQLVGASLVIIGSFLPWEQQGDFISYWTYGIQLFPVFSDNGGLLIILLTLTITLFAFQPPKFIKNAARWNLIIAILLVITSLFFVARWLARLASHIEFANTLGAPTLDVGLISVVIGSGLLLYTAIINHHQIMASKAKGPG